MPNFLIYGANGYTGGLIARAAVLRGQRPILAGRNADSLATLAGELKLDHRVFSLDDPVAIDHGLEGVHVVLHCAGPFSHTSKPMADACVRTATQYLDITAEIDVFEGLAARDAEARAAGVMLMPGTGFDVVPSDCLAAHLKQRLPGATHLALALFSAGGLSRGTATTMVENIHRGGRVRCDGVLTRVPAAFNTRTIDFGFGPMKAITIPWGDVSTAFHSTGIPNIEMYVAMPWVRRQAVRLTRYVGWLLGSSPVQRFMKKRIRAQEPGPTAEERANGRCVIWGEVRDAPGQRAVSRLQCSEGYTMTVQTALAIVERVLAGDVPAGFQTPAKAFGADFVLGIQGVVREDVNV